ncbi:MAG: aminotransferase class V-fold PLP-dependent enzyme [Candidatus Pacebacteria bacterium]|nr:aminotransferase class V-fold PLP-dependent enzyme [Candidatus Paceibacterota bacterium]
MQNIKNKFSIFENYKKDNEEELIYLDSSASSLTPDSVVKKMNEYYFDYRSNIDRAISKIAIKATDEFNESRKILSRYLNCEEDELIWTGGATSSSNMLIDMISIHDDEHNFIEKGDEILTTIMEHHSSLLPLQKLAKEKKMNIKFIELDQNLELFYTRVKEIVTKKTKIVSISLASNILGNINDVKKIIEEVKSVNKDIFVICDMTAAFGHINIDLKEMRKYIDAGYFSFHKAFGPTGVGVLFLKRDFSRNMTPSMVGGGIISHVEKESADFRSDIKVFEAGTANIAGIIGAGEAVNFLESIEDISFIHSKNLVRIFLEKLNLLNDNYKQNKNLEIKVFVGDFSKNIGIVSFQIFVNEKEVHPHDVADIFARDNISVRAGHHCAEPLIKYLNIPNGLTRVSFHIYNTEKEIEKIINTIEKIKDIFGK